MEGKQPYLGDLPTMDINHLLIGMILQVGIQSPSENGFMEPQYLSFWMVIIHPKFIIIWRSVIGSIGLKLLKQLVAGMAFFSVGYLWVKQRLILNILCTGMVPPNSLPFCRIKTTVAGGLKFLPMILFLFCSETFENFTKHKSNTKRTKKNKTEENIHVASPHILKNLFAVLVSI